MRRVRFLAALALVVVASFGLSSIAGATHFRFGSIEWRPRPDISPTSVEIIVEHAWRTSFYGPPASLNVGDASPITTNNFQFGDGSMTSLSGTVVAVDVDNDWFLARDNLLHTFASVDDGGSPWLSFFEDCCRLGSLENEPNAFFKLESEVDLGLLNTSPMSSIFPIVVMEENSLNMIPLPFSDDDSDDLTCRLATTGESDILSQPGPPFGGSLFPLSVTPGCVLVWDTTGAAAGQFWAAQVVIEEERNGNSPHGRIALDFIIQIVPAVSTTPSCDSPPTPTGIVNVAPGSNFMATIQGSDPDGGATLTLNSTGVPSGATMSPGLPTSSASPVSSMLSWTPTLSDVGQHPFFYNVTDENAQADYCSFIVEVGGVCGDNVVNATNEQCDPPDDSACPGQCQPDCTCPGFCGDGTVQSPGEQCDPPDSGVEVCNNGVDDDGDGRVDCNDNDCKPSNPPTCDSSCQSAPPCQSIDKDPAIIRFGDDERPDFFRMHGRFVSQEGLDPQVEGMSISIANSQGVVYSATLAPGDLAEIAVGKQRYRFRDRLARAGLGSRGGLYSVNGRFRKVKGIMNFAFKIKAYGNMSSATEALMTTEVQVGNESAVLEAEWTQRNNGWVLRLSDLN